MIKIFFKNLIIKLLGKTIFFYVGILYNYKLRSRNIKISLYVKELKENLKYNDNLLNKLNLDQKKIEFILKKNNLTYIDNNLSWHYHIFTGLSENKSYNILEIGTYIGEFTKYLSKIFPISKIITIDLEDKDQYFFQKNKDNGEKIKSFINLREKNLDNKNINFLRMDSSLLSTKFKVETFDFIWVDGDHNDPQVTKDINQSVDLCKKGGVICVDDVIFTNYKDRLVRNDSFVALENIRKKYFLDIHYLIKRINISNFKEKKYISYLLKK